MAQVRYNMAQVRYNMAQVRIYKHNINITYLVAIKFLDGQLDHLNINYCKIYT